MSAQALKSYSSDVRVLQVKSLLEPDRPEPESVPCTGGTLRSYLPDGWADHPNTIVELNGQRVEPDRWDHRYVGPGDMIYTTQIPGGLGTGVAASLMFLTEVFIALGPTWGPVAAGMTASFGLSILSGVFTPIPDPSSGGGSSGDAAFQTLARAGIPVPLYFGEWIVPGNIISVGTGHGPNATPYNTKNYMRSAAGDFVTNTLIALGEGVFEEICGYTTDVNEQYFPSGAPAGAELFQGGSSLKINGNPGEDFIHGGFMSVRLGKNYQRAMPRTPCEFKSVPVDIDMYPGQPVLKETSGPVDGIGIVLFFPDGIFKYGNNGITSAVIAFRVRVRIKGQTTWLADNTFTFVYLLSGPTGITIYAGYHPEKGSPSLAGNQVEVEATYAKTAVGLDGRMIFQTLEEYSEGQAFIYPGTALLQLHSQTKDLKQTINKITARCKCRKVWLDNPDDLEEEPAFVYSANPAACIKDLCLSIDGAGDEFTRENLNMPSFAAAQKYCDETIPDGQGGTMKRHEIGIEIKSPKSLMDWLVIMAGSFRAVPVWVGSQLELVVDKEEDPTQTFSLFGEGNIKAGTFERIRLDNSDVMSRDNAVDVEFRDSAEDFNWNVAPAEDRDAIIASGRVKRRRQRVLGVTNYARAKYLAHYLLNVIRYIDEMIKFEAFIDACAIKPGRVIAVHHSILDWKGISGRVYTDSLGGVGIFLDQELTIEADQEYKIAVHTHGTGSEVIQVRQVVMAPGIYAAKTLINVSPSWDGSDWPKKGNKFICGPDRNQGLGPATLYRITSVERASDSTVRITALKYDKRVYADDIGVINPPARAPAVTPETIPPNVQGLVAIATYDDGPAVLISWENADWPYPYGCQIFGRDEAVSSVFHHLGTTEVGVNTFVDRRVIEGHTYEVAVSPIAPGGAYRAAQMCPRFRIKVGRVAGPPPPLIP